LKPLFTCEIDYIKSPHLSQLYVGFERLRKLGFLDYSFNKLKIEYDQKPLLSVRLNKRYNVIFDTLDGFNWIDGTIDENLNYFSNNIKADFYFKRSYNKLINDYSLKNCKVYPLGLNYHIEDHITSKNFKEIFKNFIKNNNLLRKTFKVSRSSFGVDDYEYYPSAYDDTKVLFLARLWNPQEVKLQYLKEEREKINRDRINCILACREVFKENFMGGIQNDSFSNRFDRKLLAPYSLTNKGSFLNAIKNHNICVATTGLHNSIGWKFGEYVAASRGIVTEPINYNLPGGFEEDKNYLTFRNEQELINQITYLMSDKKKLFEIMNNNYLYYNNYLKPERLIMNALLTVYNAI
jgi:hypothetical protein